MPSEKRKRVTSKDRTTSGSSKVKSARSKTSAPSSKIGRSKPQKGLQQKTPQKLLKASLAKTQASTHATKTPVKTQVMPPKVPSKSTSKVNTVSAVNKPRKIGLGRSALRGKKEGASLKKSPETQPKTIIARRGLSGLVAKLIAGEGQQQFTFNAVEALESLIDAGQYGLAISVSSQVCSQLAGDPREHLFKSYKLFCSMATFGEVSVTVKLLARQKALVDGSGSALEDTIRAAVLLARAKIYGVAVGCLPDTALNDAKQILVIEFERALESGYISLAVSVGLEIVRLHLHSPYADPVSGSAILKNLLELASDGAISDDLRFDISRSIYYLPESTSKWSGIAISEEELRAQARMMDPLTHALVELAAIRKDGAPTQEAFEALEKAYQVCVEQGHLLGGFEIAYRLALASHARQHVARSERWYKAAEECAKLGKFRHGQLSSLLGLYQCSLLDSGTQYGAERQLNIITTLESHAECELGLATVGLNLSAIFQTSGQYKKGEEFSRKLEIFFNERGLLKQAGQAAFSEGACSAGLGDWVAAYDAWKRAMSYDVQAGDEISAAERKGAMAQAIAMDEFSKSKTISPEGMKNVRELLDSASRALATTVSNPEHIKAEAKILQTYAQLSIIGQVPIEGLKHLQRARNLYVALEMSREAALMDALSGLALLEVAKRGSPQMYEEAGHSLQRALNYFSLIEHTPIRWKIKYYLALSAYFHSQTKPRDEDKIQWRATAAEWLRDALADSELVRRGEVSHAASGESDFSPGLGPEAMDPLKVVLGLVPGAALGGKRSKTTSIKKRAPRQLH